MYRDYAIAGLGPANQSRRELKSALPFRKKALYYGLMLLLTLLAIEGMARLAYYAAYGSGSGQLHIKLWA